jgi:hypothetical protein
VSLRTLNPRELIDRRVSNAEGLAVLALATVCSFIAIFWSWNRGAMLNYGDAVAHLHIARRVFDSRIPRLTELGSVWLPLPHILLIPFVQNYAWWANGLAGVIPSALAFIASCAGIYRLARHWLNPAPAVLSLAFFALNPNLLYMQTTAMTEPLFLCEVIWIVVWLVEWRLCVDDSPAQAARVQLLVAVALIAAIFTRYDGWIIAFIVWTGIGLALLKRGRLRQSPYFWLATVAIVAAPIAWFAYNSIGFGDWLAFARGPYSAKAIELRTAAAGSGPPHPGWHNPWMALLFYLKVSELDAVLAPTWSSLWGNVVVATAAVGVVAGWFVEKDASRRAIVWTALLWLPVPFYAWSVAYGSVPIFFPAWWPFTHYNTRYGLELLPALALGLGFAAQFFATALDRWQGRRFAQFLPEIAFATFFFLAGLNAWGILIQEPIVYAESTYNLEARLPYDEAIPPLLRDMLHGDPRATVLMNTSMYPEIVAYTGIPLRQTINESDLQIWEAALLAPASHAAIVVAFDGDEVDRAVKAHPEGLKVAGRFTADRQPSATVYYSAAQFEPTAR